MLEKKLDELKDIIDGIRLLINNNELHQAFYEFNNLIMKAGKLQDAFYSMSKTKKED